LKKNARHTPQVAPAADRERERKASFDVGDEHPYQMASLGYLIINIYRGKGYATEAVKKVVKAGLNDLKFHRLEAAIDLDNKASIRLAMAAGLYREGIKKHYWYQNKRWDDQVVFIAVRELCRK